MEFIADLHVHSKYSRATARNLDLENLYIAAQLKGVTVVGTGDFTYPAWFEEISEKLVEAEPGLSGARCALCWSLKSATFTKKTAKPARITISFLHRI
jgi:PHP family Zn ribbon phosphoesterase